MKNNLLTIALAAVSSACVAAGSVFGAEAIMPNLQKISQGIGAQIMPNAKPRWEANVKGRPALFANGALWLEGVDFSEGTLEVDILGRSAPPGSNFLGLAFHGADEATFECVYFRPFNFRAENPLNASHAVQYISHPQWTWNKLRTEKTGQYEKPITPRPDGDAWFHAKIVVEPRQVSVFVNGASKPSLEVERLTDRAGGRVAIWGGDAGVGGYFANLKITPGKPGK